MLWSGRVAAVLVLAFAFFTLFDKPASEIIPDNQVEIMEDKDIGLVLLDEKHLQRNQDYFKKKKLQTYPVIVEIPDMQAPLKTAQFQALFEQTLGFVGTEYGE